MGCGYKLLCELRALSGLKPAGIEQRQHVAADPVQVCFRCMRWHTQPVPCDHDSTLACLSCGKPRGYRWNDRHGKVAGTAVECWTCWLAKQGFRAAVAP